MELKVGLSEGAVEEPSKVSLSNVVLVHADKKDNSIEKNINSLFFCS